MNKNYIWLCSIAVTFGFFGSYLFSILPQSNEKRIKEHYATETAVMVSPHSLRKKMMEGKKDYVLVDLRSEEEYEKAHIIGAVNIPAYKDPDTSAYGDVERIVNGFKEIIAKSPNNEVIAYCYSMPCMTGRKVGNMLAKNGIFIKELGIGWNEWRYHWNLWNHEHEWGKTKPEDYIASGNEPGEYKKDESDDLIKPCSVDNEFGC